jgi:hypothetical protein
MESEDRRTRNEAAFRDANEGIRESELRLNPPLAEVPYLCECDDPDCREIVLLSADEYERVRAHGRRFVLVSGHDDGNPVVAANGTYVVVEKNGKAGAIADETDPRGDGG